MSVRKALADGGIIAAVLLAIVAVLSAYGVIRVVPGAPKALDVQPKVEETVVVVAPATGVQGFFVDKFCDDPLTSVRAFPIPGSEGSTYQLMRIRDSKTETVVAVLSEGTKTQVATHYYDTSQGQQSEPAILSPEAIACMKGKAQ